MPERTGASRIARTALSLASVQGITWVTTLAMTVALPRLVGASDFGLLSVVGALGAIITLVASFGTNNHIVKEVARDPVRAADIVINAAVLRGTLWTFFALPAIAITAMAADSVTTLVIVAVSLTWNAVLLVGGTMAFGLQGNQTMGRFALVNTLGIAAGTAVGILAAAAGAGALGWVVGNTVVAALTLFVLMREFWHRCAGPVHVAMSPVRATLRQGAPFLLFEISLFAFGNTNTFILAWLAGTEEVGRFTLALRVAGIPLFIPIIVGAALYPALATSAINNRAWFSNAVLGAIRVLALALLPCAVGIVLVASPLMTAVAGDDFADAQWPTAVFSLALPLIALDMILGMALFALDRQRQWTIVVCVAAPLSIGFNFIAVPVTDSLWGLPELGPTLVALALELFLAVSAITMLRSAVDFRRIVRPAALTTFAAAAMAAVGFLALAQGSLLLAAVSACATYLAAVYLLRLVDPRDVAWIRRALTGRSVEAGGPVPS